MKWLWFLLYLVGVPILLGVLCTAYLMGAHWLAGCLRIDRDHPWYIAGLFASLILILYEIARHSP